MQEEIDPHPQPLSQIGRGVPELGYLEGGSVFDSNENRYLFSGGLNENEIPGLLSSDSIHSRVLGLKVPTHAYYTQLRTEMV